MTDESIPRSHNVYPLYYPADRDERSASSGNAVVHFSHRFRRDEDHNTWYVGPMSQKFMSAQARWAEFRLWHLYYRLRNVRRAQWASLMSAEMRLACSWYFLSDCMDASALYLVRKVRNTFHVKPRKSRAELMRLASSLYLGL